MTVVGTAEYIVTANAAGFDAEMKAETAGGFSGLSKDAETAGQDSGAALSSGVKAGTKDLKTDLEKVGEDGGSALSGGLGSGSKDVEKDLEDSGEKGGKGFSSLFGDAISGIGGLFGVQTGKVSDATDKMGSSMDKAHGQSEGLISSLLSSPYVVVGAAVLGVAAGALDLGIKYQKSMALIRSETGLTKAQTATLGSDFLDTAGKTTFGAKEIADAYGTVAGQAKEINKGNLSATQSMTLMDSAMDDAEATGTSLADSTGAITSALQAFGLGISSSPLVSNILYNASQATGMSITALGGQLDKIKSKMGDLAPPIGQMGGLLVDMAAHGETGRAAMSALGTAFTGLVTPAGKLTAAQQSVEEEQDKMGVSFENSSGQLDSVSQIIGQVTPLISGMGNAQATATLVSLGFGSASAKLVTTIQAGPAAYNADEAAVTKAGSAHKAAAIATDTLSGSWEKAKSAAGDIATKIGTALIPIVDKMLAAFTGAVTWVSGHWPQISAVFETVWNLVKPIVDSFVTQIKGMIEIIQGLVEFVVDVFEGKWGAAWDAVKKIFDGFVEDLTGYVQRVVYMFIDLPEKLLRPLSGIGDKILSFFTGLPDDIYNEVIVPVLKFFENLPGRIVSALGDLGSLLVHAGEQIIEGLIHGVTDMAGKAVDAVKGVGHDIAGGIKDVLSIFSPSGVFIEIGQNVMLGLASGITSKGGAAIDAANMVARQLAATKFAVTASVSAGGNLLSAAGAASATASAASSSLTTTGTTPAAILKSITATSAQRAAAYAEEAKQAQIQATYGATITQVQEQLVGATGAREAALKTELANVEKAQAMALADAQTSFANSQSAQNFRKQAIADQAKADQITLAADEKIADLKAELATATPKEAAAIQKQIAAVQAAEAAALAKLEGTSHGAAGAGAYASKQAAAAKDSVAAIAKATADRTAAEAKETSAVKDAAEKLATVALAEHAARQKAALDIATISLTETAARKTATEKVKAAADSEVLARKTATAALAKVAAEELKTKDPTKLKALNDQELVIRAKLATDLAKLGTQGGTLAATLAKDALKEQGVRDTLANTLAKDGAKEDDIRSKLAATLAKDGDTLSTQLSKLADVLQKQIGALGVTSPDSTKALALLDTISKKASSFDIQVVDNSGKIITEVQAAFDDLSKELHAGAVTIRATG